MLTIGFGDDTLRKKKGWEVQIISIGKMFGLRKIRKCGGDEISGRMGRKGGR